MCAIPRRLANIDHTIRNLRLSAFSGRIGHGAAEQKIRGLEKESDDIWMGITWLGGTVDAGARVRSP